MRGRFVWPVAAVVFAVTTVVMLAGADQAVTTYAAGSAMAAAGQVTGGCAAIVAGALWWLDRPAGSIGPVAMLLGIAWFAPVWIGWELGPPPMRGLAMVAAPFLPPLLLHLALTFPQGRLATRAAQALVATGYGAVTAVTVTKALVWDPFFDPYCWSNCTDAAFLVGSVPGLARFLDIVSACAAVVLGLGAAAVAAGRLAGVTRIGRRLLASALPPVAVAGLAEAAYGTALLWNPAEDPRQTVFVSVFLVRAAALVAVGIGIAVALWRRRRQRAGIGRLNDELEATSLRTVLADSLGDPQLAVAFWLPAAQRYVDGSGLPVDPRPASDRAATAISRRGETVAIVVHDRALLADRDLETQIGSAAKLAIDNERLHAEVLARLADLRASRARIVAAADSARRELERDLHDGAQQRLLALTYELRLAHTAAESRGDSELADRLAAATREAAAALDELRELAHGIFPAILDEAGLNPALESLADQAPVPVEIITLPGDRLPAETERTVYLLVAAAADTAHGPVRVSARHETGCLVVVVEGAADGDYVELHDRVGALGGDLRTGGGHLRAELPCA